MRVRLLTVMAGPDGVVQPGDVIEVGEAEGQDLVDGGFAEAVEPAGRNLVGGRGPGPESTAVAPPERAVVAAAEPRRPAERPLSELADLVGGGPAAALAEAGYESVNAAKQAIREGVDLTEIDGVGKATQGKIVEA